MSRFAFLVLYFSCCSITAISQNVIKIDSSFNSYGYHTISIGPSGAQEGDMIRVNRPDNNYIVRAYAGSDSVGYIKYKRNGTLDSSFSGKGYYIHPRYYTFGHNQEFYFDAQNRLISNADKGDTTRSMAFVRTNPNGTADSSFGLTGTLAIPNTNHMSGYMYELPDSSFITVNAPATYIQSYYYDLQISKYRKNYTVDSSFGINGTRRLILGYSYLTTGADLEVYPDGRLLLAATVKVNGYYVSDYDIKLFRFLPNGDSDPSFGINGIATPYYGTGLDEAVAAVKILNDGKIIVVGEAGPYINASLTGFATRLLSNGKVDSSYGIFGKYYPKLINIYTAIVQKDEKILCTGYPGYSILRLTADGNADRQLGTNGIYKSPFSQYGFPFAVLKENDSTLLLTGNAFCGNQCDNITTARYKVAFQPYVKGVSSRYCMPGTATGNIINMPAGPDTLVTVTLDNVAFPVNPNGSFTFNTGNPGPHVLEVIFTKAASVWKERINYIVYSEITPTILTPNQAVCADGSSISVSANTPVYWYANGSPLPGSDSSLNGSFSPTGLTGVQQLIAVKYNGACPLKSDTLLLDVLSVNPPITAVENELSTPLIAGATYLWRRNSIVITGATSNKYIVTQGGSYTVVVKLLNCTKNSAPVVININSLCPPLANTSYTSNLSGSSYQWQLNSGTGFINITDGTNYSGTNSATLQLYNIPSSWFGYQYRCVVNSSNSDLFIVRIANTWTGAVNSSWENAGNWSCGTVPDSNTDVVVGAGTLIINSNVTIRTLTTGANSNIVVNTGFTLTVLH